MKKSKKNIYISQLIYKDLRSELGAEERNVLESWLLEDRNREFYLKLKNSDHLYTDLTQLQYIDTERSFASFTRKKRHLQRRIVARYLLGLVAIMIVGLFITSLFTMDLIVTDHSVTSSIITGQEEASAVLTTSDGKILYFRDTLTQLSIADIGKEQFMDTIQEMERRMEGQKLKGNQSNNYNWLTTSHQGNLTIVLDDGTKVSVNACSKFRYPDQFSDTERRVFLEGEAYFEVSRDEFRPFIVETQVADVSVLGTNFNINSVDSNCVTTLVSGSVCVHNHDTDSMFIQPGQQAVVDCHRKISIQDVNVNRFIAWKDNKFAFEETSLKEIVAYLARWYDIDYSFVDSELEKLTFTTTIKRYPTIDQVLNLLSMTSDFNYLHIDDKTIQIIR